MVTHLLVIGWAVAVFVMVYTHRRHHRPWSARAAGGNLVLWSLLILWLL